MKPSREQIETMVEQLARQPELFAKVEGLLAQVRSEQLGTLDEAEEEIVRRLRELGNQTLNAWLREKAAEVPAPPKARRSSKKN